MPEGPEDAIPGFKPKSTVLAVKKKYRWSGELILDVKEHAGFSFGEINLVVESTGRSDTPRLKFLLNRQDLIRLSSMYPLLNCLHQFLPAFQSSEFEYVGVEAVDDLPLKNLAELMEEESQVLEPSS